MKKIVFVLFSFVCFSCAIPNYVVENNNSNTGLDFSKGKWILNNVNAPYSANERIEEIAVNVFSKVLQERFIKIGDAKDVIIRKLKMNPSKNDLIELKKGCNFDFFINIKASSDNQELSSVDFSPKNSRGNLKNQCHVILEVYDLNNAEIIYSKRIKAFVKQPQDNDNFHFITPNNSLMIKAFKRIIKDINKKSSF